MNPAELDAAIEREQARLAELDALRGAARGRLAELQARRGATGVPGRGCPAAVEPRDGWSAEQKVALFRDLFRGREDVFPVRWENRRTGRSGYAPRCSNEWVTGVCEKPRVKCGACPNQAFVQLGEREVLAHLRGHRAIGIYPLLQDDTCWLLAIDLDGASWQQDVAALRETCGELGVAPAVERSRSGAGAHVWFFFDAPVAAVAARRFGSLLLTETMARCPTLGMDSYDRLFPSQDVLPEGGFGNLIALPLQREARARDNTVFLDEDLVPHEDQWSYLASVPRIGPDRLLRLVEDADRRGRVLAVREAAHEEEPWRPRRAPAARLASERLPKVVRATLAQRLFLEREGLAPGLLDSIRRIACFENPLFLERQRMRLSTFKTPRVIACFEDLPRHLALPRGCREQLEMLLHDLDIDLELADERGEGQRLGLRFTGELDCEQVGAADALLAHDIGVLSAPPGTGKTVIGTSVIAARSRSTLVLVHRQPLAEQWISRLSEFLGPEPDEIGMIGGGKRRPNGRLDIAMVQSLVRDDNLEQLVAGYGHVVVDECHHVPAVSVERVLQACPARYVTGLTATPYRRDGHQPIIAMQCGPVRHASEQLAIRGGGALERRLVRRDTAFEPSSLPRDAGIQEIYGALAADERRLDLVAGDARELLADGRSPIVLTERREHLERLVERLRDAAPTVAVLHGGVPPAARRAAIERLASTPDGEPRLVLATGRYIGEGFDDPRLDTLLLAMPIAWKGTVVQYAGRLQRPHTGKRDARVYDYVDAEVPVLRRMFAKRLKTYQAIGYLTEG